MFRCEDFANTFGAGLIESEAVNSLRIKCLIINLIMRQ